MTPAAKSPPPNNEIGRVSARGHCQCTYEAGDSYCDVHPRCDNCCLNLEELAVYTAGGRSRYCRECYEALTMERAEAPPRPCARRMRSADGGLMWCILPDSHAGDCHGVSPREIDLIVLDAGRTFTRRR